MAPPFGLFGLSFSDYYIASVKGYKIGAWAGASACAYKAVYSGGA